MWIADGLVEGGEEHGFAEEACVQPPGLQFVQGRANPEQEVRHITVLRKARANNIGRAHRAEIQLQKKPPPRHPDLGIG